MRHWEESTLPAFVWPTFWFLHSTHSLAQIKVYLSFLFIAFFGLGSSTKEESFRKLAHKLGNVNLLHVRRRARTVTAATLEPLVSVSCTCVNWKQAKRRKSAPLSETGRSAYRKKGIHFPVRPRCTLRQTAPHYTYVRRNRFVCVLSPK